MAGASGPGAPDPALLLRAAGLRATGPRMSVLRALLRLHHATAEELAREVAGQGAVVSTVYRTLEHLERVGVVRQISLAADRRSYHLALTADHLHLRCTGCGRVSEADTALLDSLAQAVREANGFVLDTAYPVLTGMCAACRRR